MKRFLACALALSFFFVFLSPSVSAIADDESDASFWLNYWVEEHTGIDMTQIPTTAYGMSYADYIYRQTGYTVDYWVDNATNPSQFTENTNEYLKNTYYNNGEFLKDILSTTPIANNTAEKYYTSKENRIDSDGGINVSGDNYFHSVYNGLFNNNGYKQLYNDGVSSATGTVNGHSISISYAGIIYENTQIGLSQEDLNIILSAVDNNAAPTNIYSTSTQLHDNANGGYCYLAFRLSVDGVSCYIANGRYLTSNLQFISGQIQTTYYGYTLSYNVYVGYDQIQDQKIYFRDNVENPSTSTEQGSPKPYQIGYINYNGQKVPVYTDPSQNPFTINPDGTVEFPNGDDEDIYVDPRLFSPDGDMYIVQYIINNYYGDPNNSNNPFGGNPKGLTINDYDTENGTKTKDYTKAFNSIINWLQKIYNKETEIITYL